MLGYRLDQSTWDRGQLGVGDYVLLAGAGPGVTYKSAVVQMLDVPSWACSSSD